MNRQTIPAALALLLLACPAGAAEATDLRVTTDRSIDPTSIRTIVKSVCREGMTEEERALALWRLFNTSMFHWDRISSGKWENIATYGYSLCGTMWRTFSLFYVEEFGEKSVRGGGLGNKTDSAGQFHLIMRGWLADSYMMFNVPKDAPPEFLSSPPDPARLYLADTSKSGGHTMGEVKWGGRWHFLDMHAGLWARTADGKSIASLDELLGDVTLLSDPVATGERFMPCDGGAPWFFYRASGGARGSGEGQRVPEEIHPTDLRAGLRYVRYYGKTFPNAYVYSKGWERMPKWYREKGPRHLCNGEETWRHWGNGEVVFEPEKTELWREALAGSENLAADLAGGLHGADAAKPWSLSVAFRTPYNFVSGNLSGRAEGQVSVAVAGGETLFSGTGELKADAAGKLSGGSVTLEVRGEAGSSIAGLRLAPVFQYNYFLSPRPKPGENRVKVTWSERSDMKDRAVRVTWTWKEKSGPRKNEKLIAASGTEYELPVGEVDVPAGAELNPTYVEALVVEVVRK